MARISTEELNYLNRALNSTKSGAGYDRNIDYQQAINYALTEGNDAWAQALNNARNAKIAAGNALGTQYTEYNGNTAVQSQTPYNNGATLTSPIAPGAAAAYGRTASPAGNSVGGVVPQFQYGTPQVGAGGYVPASTPPVGYAGLPPYPPSERGASLGEGGRSSGVGQVPARPAYNSGADSRISELADAMAGQNYSYRYYEDPNWLAANREYDRQAQRAGLAALAAAMGANGGYSSSNALATASGARQAAAGQALTRIPEFNANDRANFELNQSGQLAAAEILNALANRNAELYNLDNNIYNNDRDFAYNQTRDSVSDQMWQAEYDRAVKNDDIAYAQWLEEFQYGQGRDKIADEQWQAEYDRAIKNDDRDYANWLLEFAYQKESDAADRALGYAQINAKNSAASSTETVPWATELERLSKLSGTELDNAIKALAKQYGYTTADERAAFEKSVKEELATMSDKTASGSKMGKEPKGGVPPLSGSTPNERFWVAQVQVKEWLKEDRYTFDELVYILNNWVDKGRLLEVSAINIYETIVRRAFGI